MNRLLRHILFVFAVLMPFFAIAQRNVIMEGLRYAGEQHTITRRDTAGGTYFTYRYKDGTSIVTYQKWDGNRYITQGISNFYDKNGKLYLQAEYDRNVWKRKLYYYPNGTLAQTYIPEKGTGRALLIYAADSTGKVNVFNGEGSGKETDSTRRFVNVVMEHYTQQGTYSGGVKNGKWTGVSDKGLTFEENYQAGKLTYGKATDAQGKTYTYTEVFTLPDFNNERTKAEQYIMSHLQHPADTSHIRKYGNRYDLAYLVNEQGEITTASAYNEGKLWPLSLTKKYKVKPARLRGVPVSYTVKYNQFFGFQPLKTNNRPFNTDIYLDGQYQPRQRP